MKAIVNIDSTKLYEHILDKAKTPEVLSNKEVILCVLSLEHLQNISRKNTAFTCIGGVVLGATTLSCIAFGASILMAAGLTAEVFCLNTAFKNLREKKDYQQLQMLLEMLLASRYENMMEAYFEISNLIQSVETEELIQFFKEGDAINE